MECIVNRLKVAVSDNTLNVLGAVTASIVFNSGASTLVPTSVRIGTIGTGIIITTTSGNFYSDSACTVLIGKTHTKIGNSSTNLFYFKPENLLDSIIWTFRRAVNIISFGAEGTTSQWGPGSPLLEKISGGATLNYRFNIEGKELRNLSSLISFIGSENWIKNIIQSDLSYLQNLKVFLTTVLYINENISFSSISSFKGLFPVVIPNTVGAKLSIDLANHNSIKNFNCSDGNTLISFSGNGLISLSNDSISYFNLGSPNAITNSTQFDNLLKSASLATWTITTATVLFSGTRTSESDAAVAILATKIAAGKFSINGVLQN